MIPVAIAGGMVGHCPANASVREFTFFVGGSQFQWSHSATCRAVRVAERRRLLIPLFGADPQG